MDSYKVFCELGCSPRPVLIFNIVDENENLYIYTYIYTSIYIHILLYFPEIILRSLFHSKFLNFGEDVIMQG